MNTIVETRKSSSSENGKTTYTVRESYDDSSSKELRVREAENGFIISIEHSYYEGEGDKKQWKCEEKTYISFDNPLDRIKQPKEEVKKEMTSKDIANTISGFIAGMTNKIVI